MPTQNRLGIAVVYLYGEGLEWILNLHLNQIKRNTKSAEFVIYAAVNRASPGCVELLRSNDDVVICDIEATPLRGSKEHSYYLDALIARAFADGCDFVATLDSDSFPISSTWVPDCIELLPSSGFSAVLRAENRDTHLPHPSFSFFNRKFYEELTPKFWSAEDEADPEFKEFVAATGQRVDAGIGYGFKLWKEGLDWRRLLRSNKVEEHFIMAGIYDDVVFHLGSGSRRPIFAKDFQTDRLLRHTTVFKHTPGFGRLYGWSLDRVIKRNHNHFDRICLALKTDPERFFDRLQGRLSDTPR